MKALVVENNDIRLKEGLSLPSANDNEVLVRVMNASINQLDVENIQGKYDLLLKLSGGNYPVKTGIEFSGVILEGRENFKKGDKVFGYVNLMKGLKTHQEVISINTAYIAHTPENLSFEQAAALPLGALTSLVALKELADVKQGTEILINGASGGLGVYAIQLAKIFGATVTAVSGPGQADFLHSLGADRVINYQEQPIESLSQEFDVLFDLSNQKRFSDIKHLLKNNSVFIPSEPNKHVWNIVSSLLTTKKTKYLMVDKGNHQQLTDIAEWVKEGKLRVFVDSVYALEDYQHAFQRLQKKGKQGRTVIKVSADA